MDPKGNPVPIDVLLSSEFAAGGPLTSQTGSSVITHPWQLQAGLGYMGFTGTTISADAARIGWSQFQSLPVIFNGPASASSRTLLEDYKDSWAYRFGAEHIVQGATLHNWVGRIGYSYAQSPAPDVTVTPLLPDMNRRNYSAGVGIPFSNTLRLDASYLYLATGGRRGRIVERTSSTQTAAMLNSGTYDLKANVASLTLNVNF